MFTRVPTHPKCQSRLSNPGSSCAPSHSTLQPSKAYSASGISLPPTTAIPTITTISTSNSATSSTNHSAISSSKKLLYYLLYTIFARSYTPCPRHSKPGPMHSIDNNNLPNPSQLPHCTPLNLTTTIQKKPYNAFFRKTFSPRQSAR